MIDPDGLEIEHSRMWYISVIQRFYVIRKYYDSEYGTCYSSIGIIHKFYSVYSLVTVKRVIYNIINLAFAIKQKNLNIEQKNIYGRFSAEFYGIPRKRSNLAENRP